MDYFCDEFLAYLEIKQDLLFYKIPTQQLPYYVHSALRIGQQLGQSFKGQDPRGLLQEHQIAIDPQQGDGSFFKVTFRAQFETDAKGKNHVLLYESSIKELAEANKLSLAEMEDVVLAHEFFHYLEFQQGVLVPDQLEPFESFRLGRLTRKARVQRTSEIAANRFTKEVLGLPHLANYYDYAFLLATKQLSQQELLADYQEFERIFERGSKV